MWKTWVQSLGWEYPLEKGKGTHSRILAWPTSTRLSFLHLLLLEPLTLHVLPRLPKPHEGKYKQKLERNLSPSQHLAGDGQRLRAGVRVQAGVDWGFPLRCPYSAWLGAR